MSTNLKLLAIAKDTNQSQLIKGYIKQGIEKEKHLIKKIMDK
jgi:hypothetical protein